MSATYVICGSCGEDSSKDADSIRHKPDCPRVAAKRAFDVSARVAIGKPDDCGLEQWVERQCGHLLGEDSLRELDEIVAKIRASVGTLDEGEPLWRCPAQRSHGICETINDASETTCGACGEDRPGAL